MCSPEQRAGLPHLRRYRKTKLEAMSLQKTSIPVQ
jgi:hypothetical protein